MKTSTCYMVAKQTVDDIITNAIFAKVDISDKGLIWEVGHQLYSNASGRCTNHPENLKSWRKVAKKYFDYWNNTQTGWFWLGID